MGSHEQMMVHCHGNLILCCKLCLTIKIVIIVRVLLGRMCKHQVEKVIVAEHGLGKASNSDGTFNILNQRNVSFSLEPPTICAVTNSLLVMVSSGPRNKASRDRWRRDVQELVGMKLVFLVSRSVS